MTKTNSTTSTRTSRLINAPRETLYRAFTDPAALVAWQVPGEMTVSTPPIPRWSTSPGPVAGGIEAPTSSTAATGSRASTP